MERVSAKFLVLLLSLDLKAENSTSLKLEKKEVCGIAPVVRCPQIGRTSESCVQKVDTVQDIHLGEGFKGLRASLRNAVLGQHTDESPSADISKNITLVKTIHSKRMKKLIANQSKISKQFREARYIIEEESIANIREEFLHNSALVRKMHSETEVRIVKLKAVGDEFTRKLKIIKNHLNAEQEKLNSVHRAVREEEEELKNRWLQAAKYGRPVHAFSILPQFVNSSFNLEDLKLCANLPSETLLLSSSINDASVLPHAMQLELKSNISEGDIPLAVQIQRLLPTDEPSEPGTGGHVSENSLFCQQVKEENHGQIVKFDKELARNPGMDQAQPVEFHDEFKMCMQPINTDFEKVMEDHSQK